MKRTNDLCRAGGAGAFRAGRGAKAIGAGLWQAALPPHEILTILRSTGLDPLGQPVRRGPNYVLRAVDDSDREVSVVVSARSGDIAVGDAGRDRVADAAAARRRDAWGPYERMPPGYVPPGRLSRRRLSPALIDDDDEPRIVDESERAAPAGSRCPARRRRVRAMPRRCRRAAVRCAGRRRVLRRCPSRT